VKKLKRIIVDGLLFFSSLFSRSFMFQGKRYFYLRNLYNTTWANERAVEIPIIQEMMKGYNPDRILEVGNVLSHYQIVNHDILDKYEIADGVTNGDACTFTTDKRYDLIVSISTLEHISWDDGRGLHKSEKAISNLRKLLSVRGEFIATFPLGYNGYLDWALRNGFIKLKKLYCLKKTGHSQWVEFCFSNPRAIKDIRDCRLYSGQNTIIICEL